MVAAVNIQGAHVAFRCHIAVLAAGYRLEVLGVGIPLMHSDARLGGETGLDVMQSRR